MPSASPFAGRDGDRFLSRLAALSWLKWILIVGYTVVSVYLIQDSIRLATQGGDDFQWDSAYLLLHHQNPYVVSHEMTLHPRQGPVAANQLPSALMVLWGYALFPYEIAQVLWLVTNLLCTLGIAYELFPTVLGRKGRWWEVLFVASLLGISFPWQRTLIFGQHAIVAFYFFLLSVRLSQQNKPGWAGIALALSFVKYTITAPLALFFLYKRWYKPLLISGGIHVVLHFAAAWWLRTSPLDLVLQSTALSRGLADLGYIDPFALYRRSHGVFALLAANPWWAYVLTGALVIALFALVLRRKKQSSDIAVLTTLSLLSLVVMYHRDYDFVVLILPFFALLYRWRDFDRWALIGLAGTTLYVLYAVRGIQAFMLVPSLTAAVPTIFLVTFWLYVVVCYSTIFYLSYRMNTSEQWAVNSEQERK